MITSSNKKIATLLILPLIVGAVKSAPFHACQMENCIPTELKAKIQQFCFISHLLKKESKIMVNVSI